MSDESPGGVGVVLHLKLSLSLSSFSALRTCCNDSKVMMMRKNGIQVKAVCKEALLNQQIITWKSH